MAVRIEPPSDFVSVVWEFPTCTVPADRCDLDHHEAAPRGPTAAHNLDPASRRHHRAKTHAGFRSWRLGHETFWTMPTGHTYRCLDEPLADSS